MGSLRVPAALKKFRDLERHSMKVHRPGEVDYDYPFNTLKTGRNRQHPSSPKKARPSIVRRPRPAVHSSQKAAPPTVVIHKPQPETKITISAGGGHGAQDEGRIFYDPKQLATADKRRGPQRKVMKLAVDYEEGIGARRRRAGKPRRRVLSGHGPAGSTAGKHDHGRVFFDASRLKEADKRRGKDRKVLKLAKDYEDARASVCGGVRKSSKGRRQMGGMVGKLAAGYEGMAVDKGRIATTAGSSRRRQMGSMVGRLARGYEGLTVGKGRKATTAGSSRRRPMGSMVGRLTKGYEGLTVGKGRIATTAGAMKSRRPMGSIVGRLTKGYEGLAVKKEKITTTAEDAKKALEAEKAAEMARLEAEEAERLKEFHERKVEDLTEKKEKILDQELEATLSNLATKKEDVVGEEFKESAKVVDADAEMEKKKAEEEEQRLAALRLKWYDPKRPVATHLIFKPRNVGEKTADMNKLVERIGTDIARDKMRSSRRK